MGFGHKAVIEEFTRQTDKLCANDNTVALRCTLKTTTAPEQLVVCCS